MLKIDPVWAEGQKYYNVTSVTDEVIDPIGQFISFHDSWVYLPYHDKITRLTLKTLENLVEELRKCAANPVPENKLGFAK